MQAELFQKIKKFWTNLNKATIFSTASAEINTLVKGNKERPILVVTVTPA